MIFHLSVRAVLVWLALFIILGPLAYWKGCRDGDAIYAARCREALRQLRHPLTLT